MARLESLSASPFENLEKIVRSLETDVGLLKEKAESHPLLRIAGPGINAHTHTVSHTVDNHTVDLRDNSTDNPAPASYAQIAHSNSTHRTPKSNPYRYSMITHHRRTVQNRPPAPGKPEHVQSAERIARSSFFLGNLSLDCTAEDLVEYCKTKGVTVTRCHVFPSKRKFGTLCSKLVVISNHASIVSSEGFWREGVFIREWIYPASETSQNH